MFNLEYGRTELQDAIDEAMALNQGERVSPRFLQILGDTHIFRYPYPFDLFTRWSNRYQPLLTQHETLAFTHQKIDEVKLWIEVNRGIKGIFDPNSPILRRDLGISVGYTDTPQSLYSSTSYLLELPIKQEAKVSMRLHSPIANPNVGISLHPGELLQLATDLKEISRVKQPA